MNDFNLEYQYQKYLERIDMPESYETRRAFMGAAGMMLVLFLDKMADLPDAEFMEVLEDLDFQVAHYWACQDIKTY